MTESVNHPQIGRLLRRSLADEAALTLEPDSNRYGQTAQAAIEKSLKALIVARGQVHPKVHDLDGLVDVLSGLGERVPVTPFRIAALTGFAGEFRYEDVPDFSDLERQQIAATVIMIRSFVVERICGLTGRTDPAFW